jgi:HEAT repeat protein
MLAGLRDIEWSQLRHAYGGASDVPSLLQALLSKRGAERQRAIGELFSCLCHQGTVYEASAAVLPFLIELLASPDVPDRDAIAHLFACIVDGGGFFHTHASLDREAGEAVAKAHGFTLDQMLQRERGTVQAVRLAGATGLHLLLPYLQHEEPELREAVAQALGRYPELGPQLLAVLERHHATEPDEHVRAAMLASITRLKLAR